MARSIYVLLKRKKHTIFEGHGLAGMVALVWWLDWVILLIFPNLNDSMTPTHLESRLLSCTHDFHPITLQPASGSHHPQ